MRDRDEGEPPATDQTDIQNPGRPACPARPQTVWLPPPSMQSADGKGADRFRTTQTDGINGAGAGRHRLCQNGWCARWRPAYHPDRPPRASTSTSLACACAAGGSSPPRYAQPGTTEWLAIRRVADTRAGAPPRPRGADRLDRRAARTLAYEIPSGCAGPRASTMTAIRGVLADRVGEKGSARHMPRPDYGDPHLDRAPRSSSEEGGAASSSAP